MAKPFLHFNELSVPRGVSWNGYDWVDLLRRLRTVVTVVDGQLVSNPSLYGADESNGESWRTHLSKQSHADAANRDAWRGALSLLDRAITLPAPGDGQTLRVSCGNEPAIGLRDAYIRDELACSVLADPNRWDVPRIEVMVEDGAPESLRREVVWHVSQVKHLQDHPQWSTYTDAQQLRIVLNSSPLRDHIPATQYTKHVCGGVNTERQRSAEYPGGSGQFFATLPGGKPVTDAIICGWEKRTLEKVERGQGGENCIVRRVSNDTFHVYSMMENDVGYIGGTGKVTKWIRVGFTSAGSIHSHPCEPPQG